MANLGRVALRAAACVALWCASASVQLAWAQDLYHRPGLWWDEQGRPFKMDQLGGQSSVVTLAYGACRRICSTSVRLLQDLQARADARGVSLQFVVIGLDPQEDRPQDWADFRRERQLMRPNWHFLTGDAASVSRVAQALGVRVWRVDSHWMHDFKMVLLTPNGRILRSIEQFNAPLDTLLP